MERRKPGWLTVPKRCDVGEPLGSERRRPRWQPGLVSILSLAVWLGPVALARATFPGTSGSNGVLAYERTTNSPAIGVVNEDGTGRNDGLIAVGPTDRDPSWNAAADRLAFTSTRDGNEEIYTADANGGDQRRLTFDAARDNDPSWSPEGTQIAFMSTRNGNPDIYVMNTDGSGIRRLTSDPGADQQPAWAPDGSLIAFTSSRNGSRDIFVMSPDGGVQRPLTTSAATDADPSWSPDATQLAYTEGEPGSFDVFAMSRDGTDMRQLTTSPREDLFPAWSPDGREIAFTSSRSGTYGLFVMPANGEVAGGQARGIGVAGVDESWAPLPPPVPVPVAKQTVNIAPVFGTVEVQTPTAVGQAAMGVPLQDPASIPVDSTIHADHAIVALEANTGSQEAPDITTALAGGTTFKLSQPADAGGETTLDMTDPRPSCASSAARSARRHRHRHRRGPRLRVRTHHHLRTRNHDADASANGTAWTMQLLCDGTLIRVTTGVVTVTDRASGRTVRVAASRRRLHGRRGVVGHYFVPKR